MAQKTLAYRRRRAQQRLDQILLIDFPHQRLGCCVFEIRQKVEVPALDGGVHVGDGPCRRPLDPLISRHLCSQCQDHPSSITAFLLTYIRMRLHLFPDELAYPFGHVAQKPLAHDRTSAKERESEVLLVCLAQQPLGPPSLTIEGRLGRLEWQVGLLMPALLWVPALLFVCRPLVVPT